MRLAGGRGSVLGSRLLLARHGCAELKRTTPQRQCKRERWQNSNRSVSNVMVSSKDTVSEQVVQARQTRRRRAEAGFWVRLVLAGTRESGRSGSNSKRDRRKGVTTLSRSTDGASGRDARLQEGLGWRAIPYRWRGFGRIVRGWWRMGMHALWLRG